MKRVQRTRRHQRHREAVMRAHNGVCHICMQPAADSIDHIVPVVWGGSDDPSNLAPAHTSCNSSRGDARPPEWAHERPSMWIAGFGPRAPGASGAKRAGASGCGSYALGITLGIVIGGVVGAFGSPAPLTLLVAVGVAWGVIYAMRRRTSSAAGERPVMKGENGQVFIDARGEMTDGGRAADRDLEGDVMVRLDVEITGNNAETLFTLLQLGPGDEGFRDGIVGREEADLIVYAMVRLASDVEASGDSDSGAAPVGRIASSHWQMYPGLGKGMVSVQVGLGVTSQGVRRCWISFRQSVARDVTA